MRTRFNLSLCYATARDGIIPVHICMTTPSTSDDQPHILVVDDDDRIRTLLSRFLTENGLRVTAARDAAMARKMMAGLEFDCCVLDVMMPGESGFELTTAIRERDHVPIILLTARGLPEDRINGLELGADDYLSKPFEPKELLLRIQNLLRRAHPPGADKTTLKFGECTFAITRGELRRNGEIVKLTAGEATLLKALARKVGEPISRRTLAEETSTSMERSVDVQVTRLRKKIEDDPRTPIYLQTVRSVGYILMAD